MKYWDIMDREEKGTFITFESDYEAQKWLKNHSQRNEGLHIVERDRQTIYEKCEAQQKEIEQLRAQNTVIMEVLNIAKPLAEYDMQNCPGHEPCDKCKGNNDCGAYKIVTACKTALEAIGGGQ